MNEQEFNRINADKIANIFSVDDTNFSVKSTDAATTDITTTIVKENKKSTAKKKSTNKKSQKDTVIQMLDDAVQSYFLFRNRDDYPDKPCIRREVAMRQSAVFNLADYLFRYKFITWEQCCEYWTKVEITGGMEDEVCQFTDCGANICGLCKYMLADTDEEFEKIIDKLSSIGCTTFQLTADELKKIITEDKE